MHVPCGTSACQDWPRVQTFHAVPHATRQSRARVPACPTAHRSSAVLGWLLVHAILQSHNVG